MTFRTAVTQRVSTGTSAPWSSVALTVSNPRSRRFVDVEDSRSAGPPQPVGPRVQTAVQQYRLANPGDAGIGEESVIEPGARRDTFRHSGVPADAGEVADIQYVAACNPVSPSVLGMINGPRAGAQPDRRPPASRAAEPR